MKDIGIKLKSSVNLNLLTGLTEEEKRKFIVRNLLCGLTELLENEIVPQLVDTEVRGGDVRKVYTVDLKISQM